MVSWLGDLAQEGAKMAQKGVPEWAKMAYFGPPSEESLLGLLDPGGPPEGLSGTPI